MNPEREQSRTSAFFDPDSIPAQQLAAGYLVRAVHGQRLTLALVEIDPGAELPQHQHDNEQLGMVVEGAVSFRIDDEMRDVQAGGIWRIAPNTPHTVTAREAGAVVIDIFAPARDEWTNMPTLAPQPARWPT